MIPANAAQAVSPFPDPPSYAENYRTEKLNAGLTFPPPPMQTEFTVFGEEYRLDDEIIRALPAQGIKQLYPNKYDWKSEMKKLNRSAMSAFLDLLELLIRCPDQPDRNEKLNDLQTIFINMHHLINEYRPLQARDTLKLMQREQLRELEETVDRFRGHLDAGRSALREELSLVGVKLLPVPRPSPLTGITISEQEEENEMPVLQQETENVDMEQSDLCASFRRLGSKPSPKELQTRQKLECGFLERK